VLRASHLWKSARLSRSGLALEIPALLLATFLVTPHARSQTAPGQTLLSRLSPLGELTNPAASSAASGFSLETTKDRLARVRLELANQPSTSPLSYLRQSLLQRLERLYEQEITNGAELESLKTRRDLVNREARDWTGFPDPRPYSIFLTDNLRESIRVERMEISKSQSALSTLQQLIEAQRNLLKQSEEKIRQLNEELEKNPAAGERGREREIERLRSQVAAATVGVLDLERRIQEEKAAVSRVRLDLLSRQLVLANAGTVFASADIERIREILTGEQKQVQGELSDAENRQGPAAERLETAREDLRLAQRETVTDPARIVRAQELLELRRAQLDAIHTVLNGLRFILQANSIARTMWEARFESYQSESAETIRQTEHKLNEFRSRIALWRDYYDSQLTAASSQVALQEQRLAATDPTSDLLSFTRERLEALRERDQMLFRIVRHIERGDRLVQRLAETLREASEELPLGGRVRNVFFDARSLLGRLWNLELFVAQDTIVVDGQQITGKRSITFGKIVSAILILVIGYWLTDLLSRWMQPIVIKRFKIDMDQATLIRRWVRFVLVLALALFSLVSVKIPLTVFAFAGGALAIALGFGMQTLLKNFVSGIIILFERPFRVGDVLDVSGQRGKVVGVGIRSSVLQLWDGTETLIPNSALLENSVTNWTYSNRKVRFTVNVGVAYGSDTRRVIEVLTEVTQRHGLVEKDPQPQILFVDFGDSALMFEVRFWADVIRSNSAQISSDLRQMIAISLAEHGIVIAFPQRDVHLDASRPLPVQVVPGPDPSLKARAASIDLSSKSPLEPAMP
jgi:potassium-dependent mechanosensitive channel